MSGSPDQGLVNLAGLSNFDTSMDAAGVALQQEEEAYEENGVSDDFFSFVEEELDGFKAEIDALVGGLIATAKANGGQEATTSFVAIVNTVYPEILHAYEGASNVAGALFLSKMPIVVIFALYAAQSENPEQRFLTQVAIAVDAISTIFLTAEVITAGAALVGVTLPEAAAAALAVGGTVALTIAATKLSEALISLYKAHDPSDGPGKAGNGTHAGGLDPIVIDLTGSGINITSLSQSQELFDYTGNGFSTQTAWIGSGNGFLVIQSTNPALGVSIGDGYELLGTGTESGFQALQSLVANSAGTISAQDALYSQLAVWQDANGDGVVQPPEVQGLAALGIESISLNAAAENENLGSATITALSSVTMADGQINQVAQVNLDTNSVYSEYTGTYTLTSEIETLPNVQGYGLLPNLQIEMSFDPALTNMVQSLESSPPETVAEYDAAVQNIMYEWADVQYVTPASGNIFDGQKLDFLYDYVYGDDRFSTDSAKGPVPWFIGQAIELNASWNDAFDEIEARLLVQTNSIFQQSFAVPTGTDLLMPVPNYSTIADIIQNDPNTDVSILDYVSAIQNLEKNAPEDPSDSVSYWVQAMNIISQSVGDYIQSDTLNTAGLISAVGGGIPFFISADVIQAAFSGTLTYVEMSALNNVVYGTAGTDLFDVSQSNMTIEGFGGGDEIIVNPGVANLQINEVENNPSNTNVLFFAPGIDESNVLVSADTNGDIILTYDAQGDQVTLDNMLYGPTSGSEQGPLHTSLPYTTSTEYGVQEVIFSDGTTWTAQQVISMLQDNGSPTNTTLYSGAEGATLNPEGYADLIIGQGGADTILYNEGYGNIIIDENNPSGIEQSVLQFGSGISATEILVSGDASGDLILTLGTTGEQITLDGMLANTSDGVSEAVFANGTTLTAAQLLAEAGIGSSQNSVLYANADTSLLDPAGYAHAVVGAGSGDTIIYNEGYGDLTISASSGTPVLAFGSSVSEANIVVSQDDEGDIILTDVVTGATIALPGMALSGVGIGEATFADGTTWSSAQILQMADTGNIYNRALYLEAAVYNVFDPAGYAHYIQSGSAYLQYGANAPYTILYNLGYGNLTINDVGNFLVNYGWEVAYPAPLDGILQFGAGITESDVSVSGDSSGDVVLTIGSTGSRIVIQNMLNTDAPFLSFVRSDYGVAEVTFTDGTTWSWQQILSMAAVGSATNTTIYGSSFYGSVIDPAGFAHVIDGTGAAAIVDYNIGYGSLVIDEGVTNYVIGVNYDLPLTTLSFGAGITEADIAAIEIVPNSNSEEILLNFGTSTAEITINGFSQFSQIDFEDGTTWTASTMLAMADIGSPLNTILTGDSSDNLFDPKGYAHTVYTEAEQSTILYDTGYGSLQVYENSVYGAQNTTIDFGSLIAESSVSITAIPGDQSGSISGLVLDIGTGTDQITLENSGDIGAIVFSDGTTWTGAMLLQIADTGSYQGQTLTPHGTSNVYNPDGLASEILSSASGNDTILYNQGYGSLTVDVSSQGLSPYWWKPSYPNDNVLQFGTGVTAAEISAVQDASGDLILNVGGTADVITFVDMVSEPSASSIPYNPQYGVAEAVFADGTVLTARQLDQLSEIGSAENDPTLASSFTGTTFYANGYVSEVNGLGGDTIVYSANGGSLVVNEQHQNGFPSSAVLQLGSGISEADVQVTSDANGDVILQIGNAANLITLSGMNYALSGLESDDVGVGSIVFADGTTWTSSSIAAMLEVGSTFNNSLYSYNGGETFDSEGIATYIQDDDENYENRAPSTFLYNAGYGMLTIAASGDGEVQDILQFGAGINASAVTVSSDASGDIVLTDGVAGDKIVLQGMLESAYQGVADVAFADGTSWSSEQILAMADIGSSQGTTLYAGYEPNVFDPNGFAHFVVDDNDSTILYDEGYGNLEIQPEVEYVGGSGARGNGGGSGDGYYLPDNSTLTFGEGISLSDLSFSLNNQGAVVVAVASDSAGITLDNALEVGVPSFVFADGTSLTSYQIIADAEANLGTTVATGLGTITTSSGNGITTVTGVISVANGYGFNAAGDSTIVNDGTISSGNNEGVFLLNGGQITNNGVIYGAAGGIYELSASNSVILNDGSILTGTGTNSVQGYFRNAGIDGYGTIINGAAGVISGEQYGILMWGSNPDVSNFGSIGATVGIGVALRSTGAVYNAGTIAGEASGTGVALSYGGTLTDSGAISGGAYAVEFGAGGSRLIAEAGVSFMGQVIAGGTGNVLELAAGAVGTLDMGGSFSGFQTIQIDAGASWTLEGTNTELAMGQTIAGFTNGDTIELLGAGTVSGGAYAGVYFSYLSMHLNDQGAVIVSVGADTAQMTLGNASQAVVPSFVFADGTTLTSAQIIADLGGNPVAITTGGISVPSVSTITGSADDTNLIAYSGDNVFIPNGFAYSVTDAAGGADTILYSAGDGNLLVDETNPAGVEQTVLQFDSSVSEADVAISINAYGDVILSLSSTGATITLDGMAESLNDGVGSVTFADGTTWTAAQILSAEQTGTYGEGVLYGGYGQSTLNPGGFVHTVDGGVGANTILYQAGDGDLTINETADTSQQSVLQFGAGISAAQIEAVGDAAGDIILTVAGLGTNITLSGMLANPLAGVGSLVFADGTSLTALQLVTMVETGSPVKSTLYGNAYGVTLEPDGPVHLIDLDMQTDSIDYELGDGNLAIEGIDPFSSGQAGDILAFGSGISASDLSASTQNGSDLILAIGTTGSQITLSGMLAGENNGISEISFDNGTTLSSQQIIDLLDTGSSQNTTLSESGGVNTFDPAGYAHVVNGNGGTDTIIYDRGDGNLLINEQNAAGPEQSILQFGTEFADADIAISGDAHGDILLTDTVTGAQITLANMLETGANGVAYGVGSLVFDSTGATLTAAQLVTDAETGTQDNSTLYAGSGNTTFQTDGYASVINGNGGADTILYTPAAGNLQINEYNPYGAEQSVLQFASGVSAADLSIYTDGYGDVVVQVGTTGAEIGLTDMLSGTQYGVGSFVFADGTTLSAAQIEAGLATIAAASTTLYSTLSSETLDTKGYFTAIQGNGGADTIIYNPGYGNLSITEQSYPDPEQSVLQFGTGISESDVAVSQDADGDIILGIGSPAAQITLVGMLDSDLNGVAAVEFSDGTTWTAQQIIAMTETGSPDHTTLVGGPGNNMFNPNGYAHVIDGDGGADTILFNLGDGTVTVNEENQTGAEQSVLQFGTGIAMADIAVSQDAYGDIILTVGTAGDEVVLSDMINTGLDGISFGIGSATFVDGTTLSAPQITNLAETGSAMNTVLRAGPDGDTIDPNGYAHLILGGSGANTILYDQGYGALTINEEVSGGTEASVLQFGSGISATDLSATIDVAGDIILSVDGLGDQITLTSMASSLSYGVGEAIFADGTTLTAAQLQTLAASSTSFASSFEGLAASIATTDEATITPFASLSVADLNAGSPTETIIVSLSNNANGSLYDPNANTDGAVEDNGVLTITGSAAEVSTILDALVFIPTAHQVAPGDMVTTTLTVTDVNSVGLTASAMTTITATAVEDAPVISGAASGQIATDETSLDPFASVVISDPDVGANDTVTITVTGANGLPTDANGTLSGIGLTEISAGVYTLVAGAPPSLTAELEELIFTPAGHQVAPGGTVATGFTITVAQNELVTTDTTTSIIATAANDPPVIAGTQAGQATSDEVSLDPFSSVTVSDPDLGVTETATITLTNSAGVATDADGTLAGTGLTKIGVGTYSLAAATTAALTAELEALSFSPAAHQVSPGQTVATGFTLAVTQDGVTTLDTITSVVVTAANDAPVISGAVSGQAMTDEMSLAPFSGVTISNPDLGVTDNLLITLTGTNGLATDADGALSGVGLTKIGTGLYSLVAASPVSLTMELEGLTFTPTPHQAAPGSTVTTGFDVSVIQNGLTTSSAATSVIVTAANDAAVISGAVSGQTTTDETSLDPFSGVTITDPDYGVTDSMLITLTGTSGVATDADGTLSGTGLVKLGVGLYSLSAVSPVSLTTELEALTFTPTAHQVAPGSTVTTNFDLAVDQNGLVTTNTAASVIATGTGTTLVSNGTLYALQSGITLNAGGTLQVVNGSSFASTILYHEGEGALTIEDANPAGPDQSILQLGSGITEGVLKVSVDAAGDILLKDGVAGDTITLTGMDTTLDDGIGSVLFADGTSWTAAELIELATLQSTASAVSDYSLSFGTGARTISGAGVFVVGAGVTKSEVIFESNNSNGNLTIALLGANGQPTGDSLTISGYWWNEKGQATVLFADGSTLAVGNQVVNTWVGTTTQTTLAGSNFSPNLFDLGPGGDQVALGATYNGGNGQNTLEFGYGDGAVTVTPNGASATIAFGANILPSEVAFQSSSNGNLSVELLNANGQPTGDSLTIDGYWWNTSGTNLAVFANGTTLAINHQLTETWIGTTAQTTLVGSNFAPNLFDLGPGGDQVTLGASYNGGNGENTLEFGYGDGAVTVTPNQGSVTIAFGANIISSDVIFESNNNNGNLTIELLNANGQPSGDSMTIDGYWWNSTGTNLAVFANGTTLTLNHQLTETWIGSATQTTLVGSDFTPNVFDLGAGGDKVTLGANYDGGNGQNIVNFGTGDGVATISGYGGSATVNLAAGITLTDVTLSTDSSGDIILALDDGTDKLVVSNALYSSSFQQLDFANGTTLSQSQILYTAETGTTGNDTITVPSGAEVIDGRGGNDVINGGNGYDSYIYHEGYGNLTINNAAGGGTVANGELDFGPGITEQDLWFSQSGENLEINVLGSQSQIVIDNWFGGNNGAQLAEIKAYDGVEIDAGLNQLVAAMAAFQSDNTAFNPETAFQMPNDPSLQAALAAAWHNAA
jgi:plastocyanin